MVNAWTLPRALYPFEGKVLDRNGLRYHYLDEGQGEPVLMLHGNPTWSFYYRELVRALSPSYRVIVPDHIGMGLSDKPGDDRYGYRLQDRVDDVAALVDSLALPHPLTLVLHDWGGMIGMALASLDPARIARIVLLNTAAFRLPTTMRLPWALRAIRRGPLGPVSVLGFNAFSRAAAWVGCKRQRMPRALRDVYCGPYDSPAHRLATLRFVQDIPVSASDPSYALVSRVERSLPSFAGKPVLICWGCRDFVFTPEVLSVWERHWPHATVHRFEDCGHYVLEDAPVEICAAVREFLRAHPLEAPR